jgi:RNA polymerase sigma factor (sigma-70 family)
MEKLDAPDGLGARDTHDGALVAALDGPRETARAAWSVLVRRHSARMYAVARAFALDPQTAEDLVQTAWLRLLDRPGQLRDPDAVGSWLCMIVRNEARRLYTRRRELPVPEPAAGLIATGDAVDGRLLRDEQARALRLAFANLGEECQRLLRLVLADPPLSYDEIALLAGRPRGSLGPTRRRCLDHLRRNLPPGFEP